MINIYQPTLGKEELKAIEEVFNSNWLGKGPKTEEFIKTFATYLTTYVYEGIVATPASPDNLLPISSCTEGLFQSIDLYINEGDEVILPSISFIGAINAILSKKGIPILCDVDKRSLNVTYQDIEKNITSKTKAVILLHYAGVPCDIENISKLCKEKNIKLIEDNANSPFSRFKGQNTGTFGDVGLWSFDSMKQLVMGDGGMIYCKDKKDIEKLTKQTYLGLETTSGYSNPIDSKWWEYDISTPGRRCIINDIQASIGIVQLSKIKHQLEVRKSIHERYNDELGSLGWLDTPPTFPSTSESSYYMYHIQTKNPLDRDKLAEYLRKHKIYCTFRYYPLHWVPYFKLKHLDLPNTEYVANHTLCIPLHQSLKDEEINHITNTIKKFKK